MAEWRVAARGASLRAYLALLRGQVRSQTSYRASFTVDLVSNLLVTVGDVIAILVLFRVTTDLAGFSRREALVMVGLSACAFACADLAVGNIDQLRRYVRTGLLDALLVRPLGALPQLLAMDLPLRKVSRAVFGVAVLVVFLVLADIDWTPSKVVLAVVAPVGGAAFFAAVFVAGATVAFWWIESGELASSVTYGGRETAYYPMTVYEGVFRRLFGFVLGFAFVAYYPALALLGRDDPLGLPGWVGWVAPAVALPAAGVAAVAWRVGIRHYRSTGS
ncbi:MAG: ABC-2 family transporter protein [Micromonosporaceae bacterium]